MDIPLVTNIMTSNRSFGHFARVLVDVDLAETLRDQVLVERTCNASFVDNI